MNERAAGLGAKTELRAVRDHDLVAVNQPMTSSRPPDSAVDVILDLAKLEFDSQFKITERYDSKVRTTLGVATLLFGIAQTSLVRVLTVGSEDDRNFVFALAVFSFFSLAVALFLAIKAILPTRRAQQVKADWLLKMLEEAQANNNRVHLEIVNELILIVRTRQEDNSVRAELMRWSQGASIVAVVFAALQLLVQVFLLS